VTIDLDGSGGAGATGSTEDSRLGSAPAATVVPANPVWERPALVVLLLATAVTYLWQLDRNGWANTYYSAAVQAGTQSWKAVLFGSLDSGNFITVDKPPLSLWAMDLSGRIFGLNSWSLLVPEVLMGVASVWLLNRTVRRVWGPAAGLLAGLVLAVTPAAMLMFRYDNPDAALTLLLVAAAYALTRALEGARLRWLVLCAVLFGSAFLTKELQGLIPLPAMAIAYLVCAPATVWVRIRQLLVALVVLVVTGGWWVALVEWMPASARPYIGGSNTNSVLELLLGYNGFGRLTGNEIGGSVGGPIGGGAPGGGQGGPGGGSPFAGTPGLFRLSNEQFAGMASWLLPTALIGIVAAIWLLARQPRPVATIASRRSDSRLGSLILWSGWTLVTAAVLSFGSGVIHPYYAVALAPGIAALSVLAVPALWSARGQLSARLLLVALLGSAVVVGVLLLGRVPTWHPELRWLVLVAGVLAAVGILASGTPRARSVGFGTAVAVVGLVAALTASTAWSLATLGRTAAGGDPSAGPAVATALRGGFGGGPGGGFTPPAGFTPPNGANGFTPPNGANGFTPPNGANGFIPPNGANGFIPPNGANGFIPPNGAAGGPGGGQTVSDPALTALLQAVPASVRWVAAAPSSMSQGPLQLASGRAVMALGGFGGGDPAISLDGFKALVAKGEVRYYIGGSGGFGGGQGGPGGGSSAIQAWVTSTFTAQTVGDTTVYDLSAPQDGS